MNPVARLTSDPLATTQLAMAVDLSGYRLGDSLLAATAMSDASRSSIRDFVEDYRRIRMTEGLACLDPEFSRRLPFRDTTGRNAKLWRVRAAHYLLIRAFLAVFPRSERVLDVGAGNGWLARRLARSYRVTALDVDATATGLGALGDDSRVARVRGEIEALPFGDERFDVVIVAAALHYAVDLSRALSELGRVLRPGGGLVIADSPVYVDAQARHHAWQRTQRYYGEAGAEHLATRYRGLTRGELDGSDRFRFLTLTPGIAPWRLVSNRLRGRDASARLPVLVGFKR
jgi:SAM-dependent methyltransferase